jgi:hypothetical protein
MWMSTTTLGIQAERARCGYAFLDGSHVAAAEQRLQSRLADILYK